MPTARDSFRRETGEALCAWLLVQSLFASPFCLRLHCLFQPCLNKLMLFLANDENGTRRGAHDTLRRGADAEMPPTGITMCGDHDEIDVQLLGRLSDLIRCMPDTHD